MGFLTSSPTHDKSSVDKQRINDLEEQLKELSTTAAAALDRVWELEQQLEGLQTPSRGMSRSHSASSNESFELEQLSDQERLRKLCSAVDTIHKARSELREPVYFRYV